MAEEAMPEEVMSRADTQQDHRAISNPVHITLVLAHAGSLESGAVQTTTLAILTFSLIIGTTVTTDSRMARLN